MVTDNPQALSDGAAVITSLPREDGTKRTARAPHLHVRVQRLHRFRLLFAEQADGRGGELLPVSPVAVARTHTRGDAPRSRGGPHGRVLLPRRPCPSPATLTFYFM